MNGSSPSSSPDSIGGLIRGLLEDVSTLFRSEIALAKMEIRQTVTSLGVTGALAAGAVLFVLLGVVFLFVTLVLLLALFMPAWGASLTVAVVLFLLAALFAVLAKKKAKATRPPTTAIRNLREDVELIRAELQRPKTGDVDE